MKGDSKHIKFTCFTFRNMDGAVPLSEGKAAVAEAGTVILAQGK